ncbi:MAG: sigma factor-like helix-turn-helix DNA-binding protein [Acidobacteriota bacterium]|nr:sigma factor-like helix-turn-helix DNA-binding protein [Acidobacteriota bacterium]NLT33102.1 RNA polymerase subunit sigma-70 [Acidobacteriota bacterium]
MQQTGSSGGRTPSDDRVLPALLLKIAQGDRAALAEFYDRTGPLVFGLALGITGDRARAEEAVLDVYTIIWKEAAAYDPALPPLRWLVATARERALLGVRRPGPAEGAQAGRPGVPWLKPGGETPATAAPAEQERARAALSALPEAQREVLIQAYGGASSCDEIATRLGKPLGAVKTLLRLGMNRMAETAGEGRA